MSILIILVLTVIATFITSLRSQSSLTRFCLPLLLGVVFLNLTTNLPAQAALANQDSLNLTPSGGQYSGLEQVKKSSSDRNVSDAEIEQKIQSEIRNDLTINSANGSVIVSGKVENKQAARKIVERVKAIPGVKEVTFELRLENE